MYDVQAQEDVILEAIMDEYEWVMAQPYRTKNNLIAESTIPSPISIWAAVFHPLLEQEESVKRILYYCDKYHIFIRHNDEYLNYFVQEVW